MPWKSRKAGPISTADVGGLWAAGVEGATCGRVEGVGHLAFYQGAGAAGVVHFRSRIQQHLGVRVLRVGKQGVFVGQLHQTAADHNTHPVQ